MAQLRIHSLASVASLATSRKRNTGSATMHEVVEAAKALGIMVWRQNPIAAPLRMGDRIIYRSNASGKTGLSDIGGVCPGGRFVAIEVKSGTGRLSPRQALYLDDVARLGGLAVEARSADDVLRTLGRGANGGWYGLASPFRLTADQRAKAETAALRDDARAKARRAARRAS